MVSGVIFDIDGTLVDSVQLHTDAWVEALRHFGFEVAHEKVWSQIGKGSDELLPALLPADVVERREKEIDKYRSDLYKRDYFPRVKAFPGVRALFERLKADGVRIALGSSAKGDELDRYMEIADIKDLVEAATSSSDADKSKPHPDIFHAACDRLKGVDRSALIVVGDTPYDAEAAGKAGLRTVGVRGGGWPDDKLKAAGCVAIYDGPADLLANYDTSPLARG